MGKTFPERLLAAVEKTGSCLCVGIDPHPDRLLHGPDISSLVPGPPPALDRVDPHTRRAILALRAQRFGEAVIEAAAGRVPAIKPQFAFFEALGPAGMDALAGLCQLAQERGLLVIGDAKRGDIGTTARAYAEATLVPDAPFPVDALTVSPFLGLETLRPFVDAADAFGRGLFVLLRTSNPDSGALQVPAGPRIAEWLDAQNAARRGVGTYGPIGAVVGATHRDELRAWRVRLGNTWLLIPGFGAQGATAEDVRAGLAPDGSGGLVVAARSVTFPDASSGPVSDAWNHDPVPFITSRIAAANAELAR